MPDVHIEDTLCHIDYPCGTYMNCRHVFSFVPNPSKHFTTAVFS